MNIIGKADFDITQEEEEVFDRALTLLEKTKSEFTIENIILAVSYIQRQSKKEMRLLDD